MQIFNFSKESERFIAMDINIYGSPAKDPPFMYVHSYLASRANVIANNMTRDSFLPAKPRQICIRMCISDPLKYYTAPFSCPRRSTRTTTPICICKHGMCMQFGREILAGKYLHRAPFLMHWFLFLWCVSVLRKIVCSQSLAIFKFISFLLLILQCRVKS